MVRDRYLEAGSPCGAAYPASTASRFSGEYAIDGSNGSGSRVHPSLRTVRISSGRGRKWAMQGSLDAISSPGIRRSGPMVFT